MPTIDIEALYQRYAGDVFRFALYLSGNRAEAEDIASETFVRVWKSGNDLRPPTVKAYLFAIARNLYVQDRRRQWRRSELSDALADQGPGPHAEAAARVELAAVLKALQSLPEVDRAALLMRAQDQMPYEEIAATLGLSLPAARVKVHRARVRLATLCGRKEP
jgi:RNA polymerase sigma-70 factor, ECF subfamily